jgi:hemolysin III
MSGSEPPTPASASEIALRAVDAVKPKLRGWLHAGTFPVAVIAGAVLVVLAPAGPGRDASAVFAVTAALLFGVSAIYHRGRWSPPAHRVLKRLDHANIFLIIAGTYTPFTVLLLPGRQGRILLGLIWSGALLGVALRLLWADAPRWLFTPVYIALGWAAVFYLPEFLHSGGPAVLILLITGGALYSVGGVVYAAQRPNPSPQWFGFHEVFHALTLVAFVTHYAAVSIAVYTRPGG